MNRQELIDKWQGEFDLIKSQIEYHMAEFELDEVSRLRVEAMNIRSFLTDIKNLKNGD